MPVDFLQDNLKAEECPVSADPNVGVIMKKSVTGYLILIFLAGFFTAANADPLPQIAHQPTEDQAVSLPAGTGFIPPNLDFSHLGVIRPDVSFKPAVLPERFDWRESGGVSSVKNQSSCGACYSFATLANIEGNLMINGEGEFDFSENNIKECEFYESSCSGGNYLRMANFLSQAGTVLESCDPYEASDVACNSGCEYQKTLLGWIQFSGAIVPNADDLKNFLYTHGPVYTSLYVGDSYNTTWQSEFYAYDGSYVLATTASGASNHAVTIVGWDDTLSYSGGQGAWIVKNSWGQYWGGTCDYGSEGGYFYIAYGDVGIGGWVSTISDYQDYESTETLYYYDEAGMRNALGYSDPECWAMAKFTPVADDFLSRVEFWTTDAVVDLDIYVYDNFNGSSLSNLLASQENLSYDYSGYYSVELDNPFQLATGNSVYVVVKFENLSYGYPLAVDDTLTSETNDCWMSPNGSSWQEMGSMTIGFRTGFDPGIRMRTTPTLSAGADDDNDQPLYYYELQQNYPNPFNPTTTIFYNLAQREAVTLKVYNLIGQEVTTLVNGIQEAGPHQIDWDGCDSNGKSVASGIYFYRVETENYTQTRKMVFLK